MGICITGIFYQYGFQENYCLIFLVRFQKCPNQRVYWLSGGRGGVVSILEGRDRLIVFVASDKGRSKNLIGCGAVVIDSPDRLGNLLCADPVLSRQPDLRQHGQNPDVVRPPIIQSGQNILSASYASSTLQETNVFKADLRIEIRCFRRVREL